MTTIAALAGAGLFAAVAISALAFAHRLLGRVIADLRADDADEIDNRHMREGLGVGRGGFHSSLIDGAVHNDHQ